MITQAPRKLFAALGVLALAAGCGGTDGGPPTVDTLASSFTASVPFGTPADGVSLVTLTATVIGTDGVPMNDLPVEFSATGFGNTLVQPGPTDMRGITGGTLASVVGEFKTITATVELGSTKIALRPAETTFVRILSDTFFVRSAGSDADTGTSPINAWRTIGHALTRVGAGDTLYVGAGVYGESLAITTSAPADRPLVIRGDRDGCFTGDAGEVLLDAGGATYGFRLNGASNVLLRGFSITGSTVGGSGGGAIWITGGSSDCAIVECSLYENDRGIHAASGARVLIEGNRVSSNFFAGIVLGATSDTSLVQNIVYANAGRGIFLASASTNVRVEHNTLFQNGADQFHEGVAGSTGLLAGNVVSEGGNDGIYLSAGTSLGEGFNLAWANTGDDFDLAGALVNPTSVIGDPFLVNPFGADGILGGVGAADDDFRFLAGSPALDRGNGTARDLAFRFAGAASTMTSHAGDVLDGSAPDGSLANLGYHYPVPVDPFASLGTRGARVSVARSGDVYLGTRAWDNATGSFSAATRALAVNADIDWVVHRVSPLLQPEELVAVLADTGNETYLVVREWDGRKWNDTSHLPITSNIKSANTDERGFDIVYEQVSGEALLVYSNDDADPLFRTLERGKWSADATVFGTSPGNGSVLWVELIPRAGSDQVALIALDDQENLFAAIWDGDSWTNPYLLDTQIVQLRQWRAFDAAWESLSGRLLVAWGFATTFEQARMAIHDPSDGSWTPGLHDNADAIGAFVELVSDPASNQIMGAFGEGPYDDDVTVDVWDGTDWVHNLEVAPQGLPGLRDVEIGWLGTSGRGFAVYRNQNLNGSFNVAEFNNGLRVRPAVTLPGVGRFVRAESRPVPGEDRALLLLLDENGALFGVDVTWDPVGTLRFTLQNGGQPLETGLDPNRVTQTFSMDFRRL